MPRNFLHLTGVTCSQNISSKFFYKKALSGKLSANDFELPDNGTAVMKLQVLPSLMQLCSYAKMIGHYDGSKSVLHTEKLAGNIYACLGFVEQNGYYIPNTALKEDIRDISVSSPQRILVILEKHIKEPCYQKIAYLAKGATFHDIPLPEKIREMIQLDEN